MEAGEGLDPVHMLILFVAALVQVADAHNAFSRAISAHVVAAGSPQTRAAPFRADTEISMCPP